MKLPKSTHELKCLKKYFTQVLLGKKNFELRKNDRDYKVGDILQLHEVINNPDDLGAAVKYTGRSVYRKVTYILTDYPALQQGYVILSIKPINN